MIAPQVGDIVLYYDAEHPAGPPNEPRPAMVVRVRAPECLDLVVFTAEPGFNPVRKVNVVTHGDDAAGKFRHRWSLRPTQEARP